MRVISIDLKKIRDLRIDKGITFEEMSERLGYPGYHYYYKKEVGIRKMSVEDIARIAAILEVPMESLFFEEELTDSETFAVHK